MTNRYDYKYFCNFYNKYKYKCIYDTECVALLLITSLCITYIHYYYHYIEYIYIYMCIYINDNVF